MDTTTTKTKPAKMPFWDALMLGGIGGICVGLLLRVFNTDRYTGTKQWIALFTVAILSAVIYTPLSMLLAAKSRRVKAIVLTAVFILALVLGKIMHDAHWYLTLPFAYFK